MGNVLFSLSLTLGIALLFASFMSIKERFAKHTVVLYILTTALIFFAIQTLGRYNSWLVYVFANLAKLIFLLLSIQHLFDGVWYKKVLVVCLYFAIIYSVELIVMFFVNVEMNGSGNGSYHINTDSTGTVTSLMVLGIILVIKMRRRNKDIAIGGKLLLLHMLIAGTCFIPTAALVMSRGVQGSFSAIEIMIVIAFLLLIILFYITFEITDAVQRRNQAYQLQEQRHQLMQEYYWRVESQQKEIRAIKHDLKNQLISLNAYYEAGEKNRVGTQIHALIERISEHTKYDFTAHSGMNAILGAKMQEAEADNIICEFDAKLPGNIQIEETDLASLTGNILDNAIEACRYCTGQRYIRFRCVHHLGSLVINSENSTDSAVDSFDTRKADKVGHGLGIKSIKTIVEKYSGQMKYEFSPHHFTISLTLFEKCDGKRPDL